MWSEELLMQNAPIVFIHMGNQRYLRKVIKQAELYNRDVFLVGDQSNKTFARKWISANKLEIEDFNHFESLYIHMSTNTYEFELGCIKRYYLLKAFMEKQNLDMCFMLDSDVCIYSDLNREIDCHNAVALSAPDNGIPNLWCMSPHCSFWKKDFLDSFIKYIEKLYKMHDLRLEKLWNYYCQNNMNGGISDMVLLHMWIKEKKIVWKNLASIDGTKVFDDNISSLSNYKGQLFQSRKAWGNRYLKKIVFEDGLPYFYTIDQKKIRSCIIHAQGENKMYISIFTKCRNWDISYFLTVIYHDSTEWFCKNTRLGNVIRAKRKK